MAQLRLFSENLIFIKILIFYREQQRLLEKDRLKEETVRREKMKHADEVRKQIIDKEALKMADRKAFFEEGVKMEEEAKQRRARLDEVRLNWQFYSKCIDFYHFSRKWVTHIKSWI